MKAWLFVAGCVATSMVAAQQPGPLTLVRTIALPNVEGRMDHLAVDQDGRRLFIAALENHTIEQLDLEAGTRTLSAKGFPEPQGILFLGPTKQVVVANGGGTLQFLAAAALSVGRTIGSLDDADNVRYDATTKRVYVGYGGGAIGIVGADDGRRLGDIRLQGHPESFQLETNGPRIFVNVPSVRHVAVLDRDAQKVLALWPVTAAGSNYPMALDEAGRRLFIGCRQPAKMLVLNTASGAVLSSFDIVGDTDDLFFDSRRKRLYVSGGEGFLDVFQDQGGTFARIQHLATAAGARTSLFVPELNRLYLAVPHRGSQQAEVRVFDVRD